MSGHIPPSGCRLKTGSSTIKIVRHKSFSGERRGLGFRTAKRKVNSQVFRAARRINAGAYVRPRTASVLPALREPRPVLLRCVQRSDQEPHLFACSLEIDIGRLAVAGTHADHRLPRRASGGVDHPGESLGRDFGVFEYGKMQIGRSGRVADRDNKSRQSEEWNVQWLSAALRDTWRTIQSNSLAGSSDAKIATKEIKRRERRMESLLVFASALRAFVFDADFWNAHVAAQLA